MTQNERQRLWTDLLDAETRTLYFADLVRHYENIEHWVTIGILVLSSGTTVSGFAGNDPKLQGVVASIAVILSTVLLVQKFSKKSELCANLHEQQNTLVAEYEEVWENSEQLPDLKERLHRLRRESARLSKAATTLPNKVGKLREWQKHVKIKRGLP